MKTKIKLFALIAAVAFISFFLVQYPPKEDLENEEPIVKSEDSQQSVPTSRLKSDTPKIVHEEKVRNRPHTVSGSFSVKSKDSDSEDRFRSDLSKAGFSENEIETSVRYFNSEVASGKDPLVEIPKILTLSPEKLKSLNRAYWNANMYGEGFNIDAIRTCLSARFPKRSACEDQVLQDFFIELDNELVDGQFVINKKVFDVKNKYEKLVNIECKMSKEDAAYQYEYVFVKCSARL